jgi:prepilin-type N-terminal cleavage/methylation domain-containing protein
MRGWRETASAARGVTLPELLVVISILGLAVVAVVPLVATTVKRAQVRASADQFTMSLRAARMVAVARNAPVEVRVIDADEADGNAYEYTDSAGRLRRFRVPTSARIHRASASSIVFQSNGSIDPGPRTVYIETEFQDGIERWSIHTSRIGVTTVSHQILD